MSDPPFDGVPSQPRTAARNDPFVRHEQGRRRRARVGRGVPYPIVMALAAIAVALLPTAAGQGSEWKWDRSQQLVSRFLAAERLNDDELQQLRHDVREVLEPISNVPRSGMEGLEIQTKTFAVGILTGALLLIFGWMLGFWMRSRDLKRVSSAPSGEHVVNMVGDLFQWTKGLATEVAQYRQFVEGVSRDANIAQAGSSNPTTDDQVLSKIIAANRDLQQRLDSAESTLKTQADSLVTFLSEARTDPLTRLPNRRAFDDEINRHLCEWRRHGRPFSVLVIDIDFFKKFNDEFGHLVGDIVLSTVGRRLKESSRASDLVARLGGEEFAVILPQAGLSDAVQAAERFRVTVEKSSVTFEGQSLSVTVSCGGAQIASGESVSSLLQRADDAMYASKNSGRNLSHWHDGTVCLRIAGKELVATTLPAPADGAGRAGSRDLAVPPQFHDVCRALRLRFEEVTGSPANPLL